MKRLLTGIVALAMLAGITACGGGGTTTQPATQPATQSEASEAPGTESEKTDAATEQTDAVTESEGEDATETPSDDETPALEPITFTLYCGDVNTQPQVDVRGLPVWEKIKEITNVDLEIEYIVGQDEAQKAGIMIASGDYPDLIIPHDVFRQFRDAGALVPINDLLDEHGQGIKDLYGDHLNRMYDSEGNIYSWTPFGMSKPMDTPGSAFYIANDVLKANGYPLVTDPDEYFDMIIKYAQENPTMNGAPTIAFSGPTEGWRFSFLMLGADKLYGMHNTGGNYYDPDKDYEAEPREHMEHRKEYLKRLFDLNQMGLLDPELFSQTYDQYIAKIASGRVLGMFDEYWEISESVANLRNNPDLMGAYPVPMPVTMPHVEKDSYMGLTTVGTTNGVCITTSCSDPVRAMQFFNQMATDEVLTLINWGIEGEHYTINDKGKLDLTDEQYDARQKPDFSETTGVGLGVLWNFPHYMVGWDEMRNGAGVAEPGYADKNLERMFSPEQKEILEQYNWTSFIDGFDEMFESPYGYGWDIQIPTDREDLSEINAELSDLSVNTFYSQMVLAGSEEEFNQIWDDLGQALENIDRQPLLDYYSEVVRQRVKDWN